MPGQFDPNTFNPTGDSSLDQQVGQQGLGPNGDVTVPADKDYADNPEGKANFYGNAFSWEPKKQHQFVMEVLDGNGGAIPAYLIKASAKPSLTNGEITLDHINVKRYVKGKSAWNTISVSLYDAIVPSGAQAVMTWIRQHHESATGRDGYSDYYKKDIKLKQLSPLGEVIEEWILKGAFITEANFGSLDWSTEEVQMIEMTLRYDWALLNF